MKLPRPGVVVLSEGSGTSLPFNPRFKVVVEKMMNRVNLAIDPRVKLTSSGQDLFDSSVQSQLYKSISMLHMLEMVHELADRLHWIHSKGELEVINQYLMMTKPIWQHDCSSCKFLGTLDLAIPSDELKPVDLYFCNQHGMQPTIIGRYGSHDAQYISGLLLVCHDDVIWAGAVLAEEAGLLPRQFEHHVILMDGVPQTKGEEWG